MQDFHRTGENGDSTVGEHIKILCAPGPRGKNQWPHRRLNLTYLLGLEGLLQRCGSAVAHHRDWHVCVCLCVCVCLSVCLCVCVCVCVCVLVAQSCPAVGEHMDCKPPASTVHGILKARILEWTVISFSRGSSRPNN